MLQQSAFLSSLLVSSDFGSSVGSLMQALLEARETAFSNLTNQELRKSRAEKRDARGVKLCLKCSMIFMREQLGVNWP